MEECDAFAIVDRLNYAFSAASNWFAFEISVAVEFVGKAGVCPVDESVAKGPFFQAIVRNYGNGCIKGCIFFGTER